MPLRALIRQAPSDRWWRELGDGTVILSAIDQIEGHRLYFGHPTRTLVVAARAVMYSPHSDGGVYFSVWCHPSGAPVHCNTTPEFVNTLDWATNTAYEASSDRLYSWLPLVAYALDALTPPGCNADAVLAVLALEGASEAAWRPLPQRSNTSPPAR